MDTALINLANALAVDPAVSEETRAAAKALFVAVEAQLEDERQAADAVFSSFA
ncbi:hypothetical protein [Rhodococcus sp. USK13]|uniref:hypothetical protein n=1 Tax=Rhodococcus sp. USK13 TaxID=2806442 RepID=UPI001BCDDD7B|nr:hypothetical protein [Rhodococcus sp. USK13]